MSWAAVASAGIGLVGSQVLGGGGGGSAANGIAGQITSQRIPGQVTSGEYTPEAGGFGTYNYIPTGATQIDPRLIQMLLNPTGAMQNGQQVNPTQFGAQQNQDLYGAATSNPYLQQYLSNAQYNTDPQHYNAGSPQTSGNVAQYNATSMLNGQQWLSSNYQPVWDAATGQLSNYAGLLNQAQNNPFAQNYINGAQGIGQNMVGTGQDLQTTATNTLGQAQGVSNSLLSNPYSGLAQSGANQAGQMLSNTGQQQYGQGQMFNGTAAQGLPAASQILNTAFDPQQQLYNQTLHNTQDQLGTQLARMGITDSGTGAKLASDSLRDFNINWQNNQLGRQTQGLQSFNSGVGATGQNLNAGTGMQTAGAGNVATGGQMPYSAYQNMGATNLGTLSQLGNLTSNTANTVGNTNNMQLSGNAAGYGANQQDLSNQLGFANAYGQGAQQLGNSYGAMGNMVGQIGNIGQQALGFQNAVGGMPYNAYQTSTNNNAQALSNYMGNATSGGNLNNQNIQQLMAYLNAVMSGSGNAANAANGAQTQTTNSNNAAAAGFAPLIQSGLGALGNLFKPSGSSGSGGPSSSNGYAPF